MSEHKPFEPGSEDRMCSVCGFYISFSQYAVSYCLRAVEEVGHVGFQKC